MRECSEVGVAEAGNALAYQRVLPFTTHPASGMFVTGRLIGPNNDRPW